MIVTKGTNNKIIIQFEEMDSDSLRKFVNAKVEEILSIINLIPTLY